MHPYEGSSKAFDCISHDLLISKLNGYSIDKCSLKLIHCYLKERKQRVKINLDYSTWKEILTGVPKGFFRTLINLYIFE